MSDRLTRAIFITGGGSGIGRAIAHRFAQEGWFIGLGDVDESGMERTLAELPGAAAGGVAHAFDVRDRAAWDAALAAFAAASGGRLDVLANNAGVPLGGMLHHNSTAEIERTLDVNLKGAIFGARAALPHLLDSAPGSCLLNTASAAAIHGGAGTSVYAATKFGVRALTEALDGEWRGYGIAVRSLMPGFIDTPLLSHPTNAVERQDIASRVRAAGLEITPASAVADAAWAAVHGNRLHTPVGVTAERLAFMARWLPGRLRRLAHGRMDAERARRRSA